ncbi:hypothetical protein K435DRAFT_850961 [Dendrothele bispora CBS 962.96]|uniref:Uncharacterized protein n=1 Tax=Dendrothele bispora (strain CBS 962.96) TaxID=1314807 RepID=A0A4S8MMZ0_DENBC|nr:hypothetical protein K435DRAFT_850961 [Dendrothele bispora CBS 962.96]
MYVYNLYSICHRLSSFWLPNPRHQLWLPTPSNSRSFIWTLCTVGIIFIYIVVVTVVVTTFAPALITIFDTTFDTAFAPALITIVDTTFDTAFAPALITIVDTTSSLPLSITALIACTSTYFVI